MANEITVNSSLAFAKNGRSASLSNSVTRVTMTGTSGNYVRLTQNVGTSEEVLDLGDLSASNLGWVAMRNLDSTNYVKVRAATGGTDLIRLTPNEPASVFRFEPGITPYVIADTAACDIEVLILEK